MKTLIFTLDDRNATRFVNKRQSKDAEVAKRIAAICSGTRLYIRRESESFFSDLREKPVFVFFESLIEVPDNAVVFVEKAVDEKLLKTAKEIRVFRWNRVYPSLIADRINLDGFEKETVGEFAGVSHEKITEEIYK